MTEKTISEVLESLDALQPDEPVMFSGSTTMESDTFQYCYRPVLEKVIAKRGKIRVGCAGGCDKMIQQHCIDSNYFDVQVFVPSEEEPKNVCVLSENFQKITVEGKFKKRDRAMRVGCKRFVGFYSQYAGAASGTAANALSIAAMNGAFGDAFKDLDGYLIVDFLRKYAFAFDIAAQKQVQQLEAASHAKK